MPHCVLSEVSYSRAFASIRGSEIRSVPNQSLSFFGLSVTSCSKFCLRGLLLTAKDFKHEWTGILQFFCYSHLISVLCRTAYALRYLIRVHSRPFVAKKFDLFLTNRCLFFELSVISCSKFCLRGPAVNRERPRKTAKDRERPRKTLTTNGHEYCGSFVTRI